MLFTKNSLLNYLEVRTEEYAANTNTTVVTNLSGTIDSIITAKNTIVVSDEDGQLQTVIVDKNTKNQQRWQHHCAGVF